MAEKFIDLEQMVVDVANGIPRPKNQTAAERKQWDRLSLQVKEIRDQGYEIDVPPDIHAPLEGESV